LLRLKKRKSVSLEEMGNSTSNSMLMNTIGLDPVDNPFRSRQPPSFTQNAYTDIGSSQFPGIPLQLPNWPSTLQLSHTENSELGFIPATSWNTGFSSSVPPYITSSQLGLASSLQIPTRRDTDVPTWRRATSACVTCRRRKLKCDGLEPCTPCTTSRRGCLYGDSISRRPLASSATQLSLSSYSNTSSNSVENNDEIEYSTPRPRMKRTPAQVLGI
jgi:hypothetical protein